MDRKAELRQELTDYLDSVTEENFDDKRLDALCAALNEVDPIPNEEELKKVWRNFGRSEGVVMRDRTCCFTGHREINEEELPAAMARTEEKIRELIGAGVARFLVGGAIGYDTMAAELLFRIREEFPQIQVILAYPFRGYTFSWSTPQRKTFTRLLSQYDGNVCVSPKGSDEAYLARNRYLVDNSAYCIAYCKNQNGGTAYTIHYAQKKGLCVCNVAEK